MAPICEVSSVVRHAFQAQCSRLTSFKEPLCDELSIGWDIRVSVSLGSRTPFSGLGRPQRAMAGAKDGKPRRHALDVVWECP